MPIILIIISALFGSLLSLITLIFLFFPKKAFELLGIKIQGLFPQFFSEDTFSKLELQDDISPVLDKRLDRFTDKVKEQLPMAGMFLRGSVEEKLKAQAKAEFMSALPEVLKLIFHQLSHSKIIRNFLWKTLKYYIIKLIVIGAIFGALFGLLIFIIISKLFS